VPEALPKLLVDANVFYSNAQRNLFMTLATNYVIDLRWTEEGKGPFQANANRRTNETGLAFVRGQRNGSLSRLNWQDGF
jgi:hypothetical protein